MTEHTRDLIQWTLITLTAFLGLVGLATRYVLLPWLRDQLVQPVRETHQQVTENSHRTPDNPTLPDRLSDLATDVHTLTRLLDYHVDWSEREHNRLETELQADHRKLGRELTRLAMRLNEEKGTEEDDGTGAGRPRPGDTDTPR